MRRYNLAPLRFVSRELTDVGTSGMLALLKDDPTRIFKFCPINHEEHMRDIEQEKRILVILGQHQFIIELHWVDERGLCFEYYPLGTLESYYESKMLNLPELTDRT